MGLPRREEGLRHSRSPAVRPRMLVLRLEVRRVTFPALG